MSTLEISEIFAHLWTFLEPTTIGKLRAVNKKFNKLSKSSYLLAKPYKKGTYNSEIDRKRCVLKIYRWMLKYFKTVSEGFKSFISIYSLKQRGYKELLKKFRHILTTKSAPIRNVHIFEDSILFFDASEYSWEEKIPPEIIKSILYNMADLRIQYNVGFYKC